MDLFYGDRFNVVNDEDHSSVFASFTNELANGVTFNMNYTMTEIDVNDNPQSPSYPALSYTVPSKAIFQVKQVTHLVYLYFG